MSNKNRFFRGITRSLMILVMSFSLSTYPTIGDVTGQSLWCIVKQIADVTDTVESKLFALEIGLSTLDALIAQEILIALSETELVIEKFSSVDSLIDVVGSQLCVLASQAEIISSLIDPIESQLDTITACSSMFILASTTINASGTYCLANDITGPIEINASNVVLSLNNHTVTGNVSITAGQSLVTIENGVVENTSSADAITIQSGASNITVERVTAKNALRGINCVEASGVMLTHCDLVGNITGIELTGAYAVSLNACTALANQKSGFSLISSYTNSIRNCCAMSTGKNNIAQSNNNVYGFIAHNSSGNIFENCIANATQALSTTDYNSIVAGFSLTGTSCCNKIIDCEAANAATSASGVTVPYGIYLQEYVAGLSSTTLVVSQGNYIAADITDAFSWSPDGVYLLVGILRNTANPIASIYLYQYDRVQQSLAQIAALGQELSVYDLAWSPDGRFFAVGGAQSDVSNFRIYSFDKTNQAVSLVAQDTSINSIPSNVSQEQIRTVAWSPDMKYLAIGGQFDDQITGLSAASLRLYSFNQVTNALQLQSNMTLANTAGVNPFVDSIEWSPDGAYVAVGGLLIMNQLRVYVLNSVSNILVQVAAVDYADFASELAPVTWSPDGKYLLANRSGRIFVYSFDKLPAVSLTQLLGVITGYPFQDVSWSADGRYLVGGGSSALVMYAFDRSLPVSLHQVASATFSQFSSNALAWSPDGRLIAGMGTTPVVIYNALGFPSDNVITHNETYCNSGGSIPSGTGISASSICNYVVGNTSYSNPIDPFAIQTNYFFACNVFNQLFNNTPTLFQNISLATCEPIAMPDNEALLAKQAYTKADFSSVFGILESAVDSLTIVDRQAQCAPTPITTPTTISVAGVYCLSAQIAGSIVITASEVVLNLNDHVVSAGVSIASNLSRITVQNGTVQNTASADALSIGSGCSNITISHVIAQNARCGIYCDAVNGASIENCDLMYNMTGVELNQSSNVYISKTYARNNTHSGFALISSCTSIVTECQALNTGLNNNAELNNNVYGFVAQNSFSNVFENCIANATQALSTTDYNSIVAGFALTGASNCNKIIGCEAANAITDATGVTVPYGIYLQPQFDGLVTVTAENTGATGDQIRQVSWSSDGVYLAVGGYLNGDALRIYEFDRSTQSLIQLDSALTGTARAASWSPDGQYVAAGLTEQEGAYLYSFDRTNEQLQLLQRVSLNRQINTVSWSPDGQSLAVGEAPTTLRLYRFNKVSQQLTALQSYASSGNITNSVWSPDGEYLSVTGGSGLLLYRFDRSSESLIQIQSELVGLNVQASAWSADGEYLAVAGGLGNGLYIYRFDVASQNLVNSQHYLLGTSLSSVSWSSDDRYLAVAGTTLDFNVYVFDRGSQSLIELQSPIDLLFAFIVSWSPDGRYLAVGGNLNNEDLRIYTGLVFPSDNVIKDNTLYCNSGAQYPSGVGICGSSICNYIVGNTAYSNPTNPPIVSSNYQFVCNVFNQLFQDVPTLLQNIALGSCEPIAIAPDNALLAKQLQSQCAGLSSIIDSIGIDIDVVSSYVDILTSDIACNPTKITTATTITASGSYCLANDVVGAITISANNVAFNLSGHTVSQISVSANQSRIIIKDGTVQQTSSASDAITVNIGCSYVTIQDVIVKNARYGINIISSYNTTIDHCELTRNATGLELNQAASIVVKDTTARSNTMSGFSLVSSYTCTISDCKALSTGEGNNAELTNNVYGFVAQNSFSNVFENCIANATQALSTTDYNSIVAGFALTGTSNCNKIIGCEAANAITDASGVTVPYGIYLQPQLDGLVTVTEVNPGGGAIGDTGRMVSWSPDGIYLAMGGTINSSSGDDVYIYSFDRVSQGLTQVTSINPGGGQQNDAVQAVKWSPSGMYLAVAGNMSATENNLYVYAFDRVNNTVTQVVSLAPVAGTDLLFNVSWSFDEQYLAVCGTIGGIDSIYVYWFDRVRQTLTYATSVSITSLPEGVAWSPDGKYLAVTSDDVLLYSFNQSSRTLTLVNTQTGGVLGFYEVTWSFDGRYLAVGGDITGNDVRIYLFVPETQTLSLIITLNPAGGGVIDSIPGLSWSPNGTYLAIGGNITPSGNIVLVYLFNRADGSLTLVAQAAGTGTVECVAWSPDGQYLAATGAVTSGNQSDLIIYSALRFPSDNVIKNNTVYCNSGAQYPSGVGICGSSICNYIVGNTAYSNPVNPPIVSSNYQFVCNVFNQLFQDIPSLMQNLALGSCEPIALPNGSILVDQVLYQQSIVNAAIESLIDKVGVCASTPIRAATTIAASGSYCLNNSISGSIIINASKVVLDLNNYEITGSITVNSFDGVTIQNGRVSATSNTNAIDVQSGASNIIIRNVRVANGRRGISLQGVNGGLIEQCEMVSNITGIELDTSSNIRIEESTALNNQKSGFSFVLSNTNVVSDCKALSTGYNNTAQLTNNIYGFVAQNSLGNVFENCIANATQALSTTDYNSIVAGFALTGTSNCNKIIGCEAANAITNATGVTVPYGIYLQPQFDGLISVTSENTSGPIRATPWSPDGIYLAVGGSLANNVLGVYQFDRGSQTLSLVDSVDTGIAALFSVVWSPDGTYVAAGGDFTNNSLVVYQFDRAAQNLSVIASMAIGNIASVGWSPDGQYLAVGGNLTGDNLKLYRFDRVSESFSEVDSVNTNGFARTTEWSPDGLYLAVGEGAVVVDLRLYKFDRGSQSLIEVDSVSTGGVDTVNSTEWSPDGTYLAVGGVLAGDNLRIYNFDRVTQSLIEVDSVSDGSSVFAQAWSPDGQYVGAVGFLTNDDLIIYRFDRGSQNLIEVDSADTGGFSLTLAWSPDGRYLAVGTALTNQDLIMYSVLGFPSDNVIKDNTVYCNSGAQYPSGVGINGSSICNYIVGNTAYSNPINPPIVSSNYQFVCNVFNQLFQNMPSMMQNIALGSCEPIATPLNEVLLAQQLLARVDDLGACGPTALFQATTITTAGTYCLAQNVTGDFTITATCVTFDLNNRCVTGIITIQNSDYVTVTNGVITPGGTAATAAITVASTANKVQLTSLTIKGTTSTAAVAGRAGISIAGNDCYVSACTIIAGNGRSLTTSTAGGNGITLASDATRTVIENCTIISGNGGAASAGAGGNGGHGIEVQNGAVQSHIRDCLIFATGNGGNATTTGGNGGHGIVINSGAVDTQVRGCTIRNTGTGGTGSPAGAGGKAVLDSVAGGINESNVLSNFAYNIVNSTKFDLQAAGEAGVPTSNPPSSVVINPFANVFV